jgi:serine/threonine protein kinase
MTYQLELTICAACGRQYSDRGEGSRCDADDWRVVFMSEHAKAEGDPMLGRVVGGKFPLLGTIGSGGMGAVYRGVQEPVGRPVGVKVMKPQSGHPERELAERFLREARAMGQINHPAVVTLYDFGEEPDGTLYMVMELIRGRTLREILRREKRLTPVVAVELLTQMLDALDHAHTAGLIHRDMKPENCMILDEASAGVKVKLLDFGIARALAPSPDDMRTRDGLVLGTPAYIAPETVGPRALITPRVDLYAVGIMAYEMLTGAQPFRGEVLQLLMAHSTQPVPPIAAEALVPPALEEAVGVALAKDPSDRYESASVMARALRDALIHDELTRTTALDVRELGLLPETAPSPSDTSARKPLLAWLVSAAVVSIAAATVLGLTWPSEPPPVPPQAPHIVVVSSPMPVAATRPTAAALPSEVAAAPRAAAIPEQALPAPPARTPTAPALAGSALPIKPPQGNSAYPQPRPPVPASAPPTPRPSATPSAAPRASTTLEDPFAE